VPPGGHYGAWEIPLLADQPQSTTRNPQAGSCGRCTRCLTGCPTDAFVGPYHLEPQRCLSYWTIEAKAPIPRELRHLFGNRIFGCDICQEVCPWNQRLPSRSPLLAGLRAQADRIAPPLLEGFDPATPYWLNQDAFSRRFQRSPIKRAKRAGMARNVCVALGNWAAPATVDALTLALHDPEPLVRGHAAWALGEVWQRHGVATARQVLRACRQTEGNGWVSTEIQAALQQS
jgi:epoxyqueuosine reductase